MLLVLSGSAVAAWLILTGNPASAVVLLAVYLPLAVVVSRLIFPRNETVPTVVVAGRPYTNPDPAWVREQLHA